MRARMIAGLLLAVTTLDAASARIVSDKERLRQRAEHLCYDDVQKLCSADLSDEAKVEACMKVHRAELSPACRKVFDAGSR